MKALHLVVLALALSGPMRATTIFFDEFGTTPLIDINGFHFEGVLFDFSPGHAFFNQTIGTNGNAEFSTDPVLGGPTTGILGLSFDSPVTLLQFDLLLRSVFPIDDSVFGPNGGPAYTVLLSNGTTINGSTAPQPDGAYSEGQFY